GRIALTCSLPDDLAEQDLLAIARFHFPGWDEDYLLLLVAEALKSESYIKAMEDIAKYAGHVARRNGRAAITVDDLNEAIERTMPAPQMAAGRAPAPARRKTRGSLARPSSAPGSEPVEEADALAARSGSG